MTGAPRGTLLEPYADRRMAALAGLGFASGLPLLLTSDTLAAWLATAGLRPRDIGLLALVGLPYSLKFLWAPLLDRFALPLPRLGRRRGWILAFQALLTAGLAAMALLGPGEGGSGAVALAAAAVAVACLSASQDVVADAYRADVLPRESLGAGAAVFVTGYRAAMIAGGGLVLVLAKPLGFPGAYFLMAGLMLLSVAVTLLAPEPPGPPGRPATLREAIVAPLVAFFRAHGRAAAAVLLFVVLFKLPDVLAAQMVPDFLLRKLAFAPADVGWIKQWLGLAFTLAGALAGGGLVARLGVWRALLLFGILQAASNLGYSALALAGHSRSVLIGAVAVENLCAGFVTAGFLAFLMGLTERRFSAFQFALFTSLMGLTRSVGAAPAGWLVERLGDRYALFFALTALAGLPGLCLLPLLPGARRSAAPPVTP